MSASRSFLRVGRAARTAAFATAALAAGCAASPGERVAQQVTAMEKERSPDKLVARGQAFARVGDLTRAEQYFASALDAGGDPQVVLPQLLRVCIEAKRYRVALDYAEPLLKRRPSDYHLRFVVASLYLVVGDVASARAELEEGLRTAPDQPDVHYTLAVLLRDEAGDRTRADRHFREYLRLRPDGTHAEEARANLLKGMP